MKTTIKFLSTWLVVLVGIFAGAQVAFAQTATIATSCNAATLSGTITSTSGVSTSVWFEYSTVMATVTAGAGTRTVTQAFTVPQTFTDPLTGLLPLTTYYYRVASQNIYGVGYGTVLSFTTPSCGGVAGTALATTVTSCNAATLSGTITSTSGVSTSVWFEYSTVMATVTAGAGTRTVTQAFTVPQTFTDPLTGLLPLTTYYYRVASQNIYGVGYGTVLSFTTPSCGGVAGTALATTVTSCNAATLSGTITSTSGVSTSVWFEYSTVMATVTAGAGTRTVTQAFTVPQTFTDPLTGLLPLTTYYYRVASQNIYGVGYGTVLSFTTPSCGGVAGTALATIATSCNAATLSGTITSTSGVSTSVWFEYSTVMATVTAGAGTRTVTQAFTVPQTFTDPLTGLLPLTTYYYRVASQNIYGVGYGTVLSFTTPSCGGVAGTGTATVTTNTAMIISQTSAVLSGYLNPNGVNANAWFEWGTVPTYGYSTAPINYGTPATTFTSALYTLLPNTTYYFRAVAQNAQGGGLVYGNQMTFMTSNNGVGVNTPLVTTNGANVTSQTSATLNGFLTPNGANTSAWFEWGMTPTYGYATPLVNYGSITTNFSYVLNTLSPNTTYYFRTVAQSPQGTVYGSMLSFSTTGQGNNNNFNSATGATPTATTLLATENSGGSATLNGLVFSSSSAYPANAWFDWGENTSVGNKTQTVNVGSLPSVKHADVITGLVQGRTYYYRIVTENTYGKSYGSTMSFVARASTPVQDNTVVISTPARTVTKPTVTVISRGTATQSLIALTLDGGTEAINGGEKRSYHVTWKNDSNQLLTNVVLRVMFPQTMKVESTTNGVLSSADNTVIVDVKSLAVGDTGEAFIVATPDSGLAVGDLLVVTANMVYTDAGGVQSDAVAYVTHRIAGSNGFGASIFGAGSFMPTTLLGWVILIALILALVLLGNHLYGRFSEPVR